MRRTTRHTYEPMQTRRLAKLCAARTLFGRCGIFGGQRVRCTGGTQDIVDKKGNTVKQRDLILQVNSDTHNGEIHSDLAGFEYPCDGPDKPLCKEPLLLKEGDQYHPDVVEVHHVIRKKDKRCCAWGTNSNSNAVVISRKLNRFFWYKYPSAQEVNWVNQIPPYTP